jgi:predicted negative regulator of RcsB-dependent stress response
MKVSARVAIPVVTAILVSGGLIGYAWWQLNSTEWRLQQQVRALADKEGQAAQSGATMSVDDAVDAGDVVLVHLRQGDLLSLQGDWANAEKEYQASVDAGGGIPALRKLAQAQLQRREIDKVKASIH